MGTSQDRGTTEEPETSDSVSRAADLLFSALSGVWGASGFTDQINSTTSLES